MDWPQQSRTVEVVRDDAGDIYIGLTVVDHAGEAEYAQAKTPLEIASLSRVLSANAWQKRPAAGMEDVDAWAQGRPEDRNIVLRLPAR